jgi:hypothetical protein
MTDQKHLKRRIRTRMARTGERYSVARAHVVGRPDHPYSQHGPAEPPVVDHGHPLRGGVHPDSAAVAALLARHGRDVSEAMAFGVGGGPGAGYILWEFAAHDSRVLTLGFRHRWNYLDWAERALTRLGATPVTHTTAGQKGAADALTGALADGRTALTWPDRHLVGYWHLPEHLDGRGGHGVLAYAQDGDGVRIDDRNLAPLTVDRRAFDVARARVPSYRNRLVTVTGVEDTDLAAAVDAGIADTLAQLGGTSESFALPAWRKWARLVTDVTHAKGWPTVFADGRGLTGALLSAWEGIEPAGMTGGHLRDLYADFLDEAAALLGRPALAGAAATFREAGRCWHEVAEVALPSDVPAYARLRELTAELAMGVVAGDGGADTRAEAATELWALRSEYDRTPPAAPDLTGIGAALTTAYDAERAAVDRLAKAAADAG